MKLILALLANTFHSRYGTMSLITFCAKNIFSIGGPNAINPASFAQNLFFSRPQTLREHLRLCEFYGLQVI